MSCSVFGEDRVLYGSDWPNSDQWAPYPKILGVVREYFTAGDRGKVFLEEFGGRIWLGETRSGAAGIGPQVTVTGRL